MASKDASDTLTEGPSKNDSDTSSSEDIAIEMIDIRKTFSNGEIVAVDNFDLEVGTEEFVVFLGPSGCGKTTTLRCISGLETPDSGIIRIGGEEVTYTKPKDRDLAFVFQEIALFPHMTVRENMRFGLDMHGELSPEEKEKEIRDVAQVLGIEETLDRKPSALSGGQQQRVSLGRAMVMDPVAFLLDEPFSDLDANLRDKMRVEIKKLQRQVKKAMVFVTHDQEEALTLGDKIVVMNDAEVQQVGSSHEIYDDPENRFVAEFIGSPSTNIFECTIRRSGDNATLESDYFTLPVEMGLAKEITISDGDIVHMGIRPEHLDIVSSDGDFDADITVIEHLGTNDGIYLNLKDKEIRVLTEAGELTNEDQRVSVAIDQDEMWLFDESGERLL